MLVTVVGSKVIVINMTYKIPACSVIINKQIFLMVLGTNNEEGDLGIF